MAVAQIVLLTVTLITGERRPDIVEDHKMPSLDACFQAARSWLDQDVKQIKLKDHDGKEVPLIGLSAACAQFDDPDDMGEDG